MMVQREINTSSAAQKILTGVVSLVLVSLVGIIDYYTGHDLALSLFYLIPISVAAMRVGRRFSVVIAVLSAVIWTTTNKLAGKLYPYALMFYWNMVIRALLFTVFSVLVSQFHTAFEIEKTFARKDTVTGLANRKAFYEKMEEEIHRMRRYKRPLTIAYLDCDHFKQVNDTFGHHIGDTVLSLVARSLKTNIRSLDMVARLGGDEFIIVLPETNNDQARIVLQRARNNTLKVLQAGNWPVDLSIGAVTFVDPLESIDEMVKRADNLMYAAKKEKNDHIEQKIYADKTTTEGGKSL